MMRITLQVKFSICRKDAKGLTVSPKSVQPQASDLVAIAVSLKIHSPKQAAMEIFHCRDKL